MKVTRFSPVNQANSPVVSRSFSELIDEIFQDSFSRRPVKEGFVPTVDIIENDTQYELHVNLPGMKKEDISIQLEDNRLTISGERHFRNEENKPRYHRIESGFGSFKRSFTLSNDVERDGIQARFEDGVLTVTLIKKEQSSNRNIEVQ